MNGQAYLFVIKQHVARYVNAHPFGESKMSDWIKDLTRTVAKDIGIREEIVIDFLLTDAIFGAYNEWRRIKVHEVKEV
jgi:hypothetical protein